MLNFLHATRANTRTRIATSPHASAHGAEAHHVTNLFPPGHPGRGEGCGMWLWASSVIHASIAQGVR